MPCADCGATGFTPIGLTIPPQLSMLRVALHPLPGAPSVTDAPRTTVKHLGVSYRRISSPNLRQVLGDGEDRQERDFHAFCERHDLVPVAEAFADRLSGYKDHHRKKGRM